MPEPWIEFPHVWETKAKFFTWVRGGLREAVWNQHPIKREYIKHKRVRVPLGKITKSNPEALIWGGQCEQCLTLLKQSDCEVDHNIPSGSLNDVEDIAGFTQRLLMISFDNLSIVCKPCHKIKSYADRMKITFEEAKVAKKFIAFRKLSKLDKLEELGYTPSHKATHEALNTEWKSKQDN